MTTTPDDLDSVTLELVAVALKLLALQVEHAAEAARYVAGADLDDANYPVGVEALQDATKTIAATAIHVAQVCGTINGGAF